MNLKIISHEYFHLCVTYSLIMISIMRVFNCSKRPGSVYRELSGQTRYRYQVDLREIFVILYLTTFLYICFFILCMYISSATNSIVRGGPGSSTSNNRDKFDVATTVDQFEFFVKNIMKIFLQHIF